VNLQSGSTPMKAPVMLRFVLSDTSSSVTQSPDSVRSNLLSSLSSGSSRQITAHLISRRTTCFVRPVFSRVVLQVWSNLLSELMVSKVLLE
jgi:hypothetical protein